MDAGTGILPSVRNATGGVFHAERAWATAATSVKIGGVEMVDGDSTTYYKNDEGKVNVETTGYNAKYEPGAGGQAGKHFRDRRHESARNGYRVG